MNLFLPMLVLFFVFLWFLGTRSKKRFLKLTQHTHGKYFWNGVVQFTARGKDFQVANVGTGNMNTGTGGSYNRLLVQQSQKCDLFIGPRAAYKYIAVGKIADRYQSFDLRGREFLLAARSPETTEQIRSLIARSDKLQQSLDILLKKDFQYIRSLSRMEIESFSIKRKHFIELSFLDHSVCDNPAELDVALEHFNNVLDAVAPFLTSHE